MIIPLDITETADLESFWHLNCGWICKSYHPCPCVWAPLSLRRDMSDFQTEVNELGTLFLGSSPTNWPVFEKSYHREVAGFLPGLWSQRPPALFNLLPRASVKDSCTALPPPSLLTIESDPFGRKMTLHFTLNLC